MSHKTIEHAVGNGQTVHLTTTQHSALGDLRRFGHLYPPFGNQPVDRGTAFGFGAKTLQALVDAGFAEWRLRPGERRCIVEVGQNEILDAAIARRQRVVEATAYVTSRFYPPLPQAYGELAVKALEVWDEEGYDGVVALPEDLNPHPRTAYDVIDPETERLVPVVKARDLIDALRIGHLIEDFEEEI